MKMKNILNLKIKNETGGIIDFLPKKVQKV